MLVICEGVDCGGKSTLVKQLDAYYKEWCFDHGHRVEVHHFKKSQPDPNRHILEEYELDLEDAEIMRLILSPTAMVLCDRWHTGELIYGPIYRDESRLSESSNLHVELFLEAVGAIKMLAQPANFTTLHNRFKKRGDDFLQPQHVRQVYEAYEAHGSAFNYLRPNMFDGSELKPVQMVELAHAQTKALHEPTSLTSLPTYVGHPNPDVLLVGDQRGDGPRGDLRWPRAFTPVLASSSSPYLMNALLRTKIHLGRRVGILNANEPGVDLTRIHSLENQPAVVALGSNASAALMRDGVEHERVPHPQWWKRFRHRKIDEYVKAIKNASGFTEEDEA